MDVGDYGFPGVDDITDLTPAQLEFINEVWWAREEARTPEFE